MVHYSDSGKQYSGYFTVNWNGIWIYYKSTVTPRRSALSGRQWKFDVTVQAGKALYLPELYHLPISNNNIWYSWLPYIRRGAITDFLKRDKQSKYRNKNYYFAFLLQSIP